jgi:cytochrome c oxidase subunit II
VDWLRKLLFLPEQASSIAPEIDWLHYSLILTTLAGVFLVTGVGAYFCIRYRSRGPRRRDERREPGPIPPLWGELGLIGALFALFVAWWGVGYWQYVRLAEPPPGTYDIYVSAKQWMWKFAYPTGSHTINALYVPVDRPVRLLMTSRDVIHSFFVPQFRVKHDAVPGRYTTVWFSATKPGTYPILCSEYCGTDHSRMRAQVVVLGAADFSRWLEQDGGGGPPDPELVRWSGQEPSLPLRGETVAAKYGCLRCHTLDGSPHIGPTWRGLYGARIPLDHDRETVADAAYLTESMMDPQAKLHRGFGPVMPSYLGYLQPAEVGALVELIKSLSRGAEPEVAPYRAPPSGAYPVPEVRDEPEGQKVSP